MSTKGQTISVRHDGFTLVEILVTVVLISAGLLGIAALQMASLRGNQEAHVRAQASVLAAEILDRMRTNAFAFRAGAYEADYNETGSAGTRAGDDLESWQDAIDDTLPGDDDESAGRIERDGNVARVTIRWGERGNRFTGTGASAQTTSGATYTFETRSEI